MKAVSAFLLYNSGENVLFYRRRTTKNRPFGQKSPTLSCLPTFGGLPKEGRSLFESVFYSPFPDQKRETLFIM
jgi:hypothetical protein